MINDKLHQTLTPRHCTIMSREHPLTERTRDLFRILHIEAQAIRRGLGNELPSQKEKRLVLIRAFANKYLAKKQQLETLP
jgi:hypothetical protein